MRMNFPMIAVAAMAVTTVPAGALAQLSGYDLDRNPNPSLATIDTNRDGSISRTEAAANTALSNQFVALDQNGNGALEPAEFARFEASTLRAPGTASGTPGTPGAPGAPSAPGTSGTSGDRTTGTMSAPGTQDRNANTTPPPPQ